MTAKTDNDKQLFLDALARTGIIADACREAKVSRPAVHSWRSKDPEFSAAYDAALEDAGDALESEARRRAIEGVERRRFDKDGNVVLEEVVYSDSLMALLLKANKPDKFADRSKSEITSPDGSLRPAEPTEAAARMIAILDEAKRRKEAGSDPLFD
jgi:hypothetical protein